MLDWITDLFHVNKPIIAMCHLEAMPGDPYYDPIKGMDWVVRRAKQDMLALQQGGVDAILFSNERSLPYMTKVEPITTACMARVIAELKADLSVPFGVNLLWDGMATIDLAIATDAKFVREVFTGVYASDFGLWDTNCGQVIRHKHSLYGDHVRTFFNIFPESCRYLGNREITEIARSTAFNTRPDAFCVSGLVAGFETSTQMIQAVKQAVPEVPVFANTGVNHSNIEEQLRVADGAIIGTAFKRDGHVWNEVDQTRVIELMSKVKALRNTTVLLSR